MRLSSLLLLLFWIPTLAVGGSATPISVPYDEGLLGAARAVAIHDIGPRGAQPLAVTVAEGAPQATVRIDGESGGTPPTVRVTADHSRGCAFRSGSHTVSADRLNTVLAQTRARTGFLTAASSTAPPRTHG